MHSAEMCVRAPKVPPLVVPAAAQAFHLTLLAVRRAVRVLAAVHALAPVALSEPPKPRAVIYCDGWVARHGTTDRG